MHLLNNYDVYFLGFTYSNRYHIKFRNLDIDLYPSKITNINYQKYNDQNNCYDYNSKLSKTSGCNCNDYEHE